MDRSIFLLNTFIYIAIFGIFYFFSNRVKFSCIGTITTCVLFGLINHYIYLFRGRPLLMIDIASFRTAFNVAQNYSFRPDLRSIIILGCAIIVCIIVYKLPIENTLLPIKRIYQSLLSAIAVFLIYALFFLSGKLESWGINLYYCGLQDTYLIYGSALSFAYSANDLSVKSPEGYSLEKVAEITSAYKSDSTDVATEVPNIIVIVDEAFSDLGAIGNLPVTEDYLPFFHSLSENTVRGTLHTSIFGGNTANTEFEFLTGNTLAFQPRESVTFQTIYNEIPSFVDNMKENGYSGCDAYHPYARSGWNRPIAYANLGFRNFYSIESFPNAEYLRNYVSDHALFSHIQNVYEATKKEDDSPFFLYTMTMQNHGGYSEKETNLKETIQITDSELNIPEAVQYLNLMKETDQALSELIKYFENTNDPTVIVFFGDHQPGLSDSFYKELLGSDEYLPKYQVPFLIWANYELPKVNYDDISVNYLSSVLLELTGNKMTGYQKYLADLQKTLPVITANGYYDKSGKHYEIDDTTSPYYKLIQEYRILQYNNMYDLKYREDSFFFLGSK